MDPLDRLRQLVDDALRQVAADYGKGGLCTGWLLVAEWDAPDDPDRPDDASQGARWVTSCSPAQQSVAMDDGLAWIHLNG